MSGSALNKRITKLEAHVPKTPEKVVMVTSEDQVPDGFDGTIIVLTAAPLPQHQVDHQCEQA